MKKTFTAICTVILIFSMTFALVSCDISGDFTENTTDTVQYTQSNTVLEKSSSEVLSYFNSLVNSVKTELPSVTFTQELKIDNKTMEIFKAQDEDEDSLRSFNDALPGIKELILTDIKKKSGSVSFGDENSDIFFVKGESWSSALTVDDIDSAVIKEIGDKYYITITFGDIPEQSRANLAKAFELRDKATVLNSPEFAKMASYLELKDYTVTYTGCTITASVDRLTDTLTDVTYSKVSDVSAQIKGLNTFEDYGDMIAKFVLADTTSFSFNWIQDYETSPLDTSDNG